MIKTTGFKILNFMHFYLINLNTQFAVYRVYNNLRQNMKPNDVSFIKKNHGD